MQRWLTVVALATTGMVAGCGLIPNQSLKYREAEVVEPMTVPDGWVFIGQSPLYEVPDADQRLTAEDGERSFQAPKPPDLVGAVPEGGDQTPVPASPAGARAVLAKDGTGYPIIMMPDRYAQAWESVGQALTQTDLRVTDRNRDQGVFFLTTPERYQLQPAEAQLKLSHTTNGIQVALMNAEGTALADKAGSLAVLESLYGELQRIGSGIRR
ncbi:outer membrane protein assembly factor BamC [Alloalcanivorax xenomutans]|uniref:Outer membrane protein assembly factor BamC n=2 Tax=Alloalcanivorax xenomutans TaxID=1094342 RepID=A0A9Q3ZED5_9GAMM|nr:outer membrane protein assembly factor BamC [Alloalcanivorax xenomutans]ERS12850.1 hypothetical protein Q668_17100 [Alcanivorax sp. PN-3]KYZ86866.1 hypothetical protein A3Q32_14985 [Alcanivorax sp. KX64203]PHS55870.1 MAG: outer membrane protein assembly factor BamC [Alcanivorax sp.]MCE7510688.1 outer membrane protein assembly factor BamC [Alloalcanivorax xenomutans]MCE7525409.1 outer membrane protein assembly factor BamC [Alloalcanivorax xenomutans]